ncbi:MAG TPA: TonB-dependent receptor, partial [Tahibacter sp.]|nr:TonB-dependent receptor [Tahibacter sp.]
MKTLRKSALCIAMGVCLSSLAPFALAAANDGSLVGRLVAGGGEGVAGAQVTVRNVETGLTRSVRAGADGEYRFPFLPIGTYVLEATKDGFQATKANDVRVSLGNATSVNLTLAAATTLEAVEVVGSAAATIVDVTSTESATNLTKTELDRLPVERSAQAVALLAPGVTTGAFGGVSFGGSSVAENTVYINGLNVTDFYRRIGFSSVPFSFFKEFQVKTGGYSVEFGRTTGGVINAVTNSGSNEFKFGSELIWEPSFLQTDGKDKYNPDGSKVSYQYDEYDRTNLNVYASGPIVPDKLFFYVMYEARDYKDITVTNDEGQQFRAKSPDDFWGAKFDWQITDGHLLEFLAFSDKNSSVRNDYVFDGDTGQRGAFSNRRYTDSGGTNYALTYTGYLSDTFSMKLLAGGNERDRVQKSLNDIDCSRIRDRRSGGGDVGCTTSGLIEEGKDDRKAYRLDFEWSLTDHLLRFGLDREQNTSDNVSFYPGPDRLLYEIFTTSPGATLANGGVVPAGVTAYVRGRQQEVSGTFETLNTAYYLEDNWSITPRLTLNLGLRLEGFDNKNGEGDTYIKMDDMLAPRLGLSW